MIVAEESEINQILSLCVQQKIRTHYRFYKALPMTAVQNVALGRYTPQKQVIFDLFYNGQEGSMYYNLRKHDNRQNPDKARKPLHPFDNTCCKGLGQGMTIQI